MNILIKIKSLRPLLLTSSTAVRVGTRLQVGANTATTALVNTTANVANQVGYGVVRTQVAVGTVLPGVAYNSRVQEAVVDSALAIATESTIPVTAYGQTVGTLSLVQEYFRELINKDDARE
jgi:hypothetical protein